MKKIFIPLCTLAMALVSVGTASATAITSPGLSVTSGGLTFSNFTCAFTSSGNALGGCSTVDVTPLTPPPAGIQFSTNLSTLGVSSADAALAFWVNGSGISDVGLSFNSSFLGLQVNSVTEDIYTAPNGTLVGTMTVDCGTITGCSATTVAHVALTGGSYSSLYVTKDINLSGFADNAFGTTSIITQSFNGSATPEPMSMALIGGGLALVGIVRMRKNKA